MRERPQEGFSVALLVIRHASRTCHVMLQSFLPSNVWTPHSAHPKVSSENILSLGKSFLFVGKVQGFSSQIPKSKEKFARFTDVLHSWKSCHRLWSLVYFYSNKSFEPSREPVDSKRQTNRWLCSLLFRHREAPSSSLVTTRIYWKQNRFLWQLMQMRWEEVNYCP